MKEKQIEQKLVRAVMAMGGLCPKLVSPGAGFQLIAEHHLGVALVRMVLMPGGRMAFAELKAPGRKPRPLQLRRMAQLSRLGFRVYVIDGPEQINEILKTIGGTNEV